MKSGIRGSAVIGGLVLIRLIADTAQYSAEQNATRAQAANACWRA